MTLSMPVKIVALAGLALILGAGGLLMVAGRHHAAAAPPAPVAAAVHPARHTPAVKPAPQPKPHPAPVHIDANVPPIVAAALRRHPVVVVAIYDSRNAGDRAVYREARAGAHTAHAGFIAADVAKNKIATGIATWSANVAVPAVIVSKRPGSIVFGVPGATDRDTVAQAAFSAR